MRQLKREFTLNVVNADFDRAGNVQQQYAQEFPDFHQIQPLTATMRDINRYQEQQRITAVQRMLKNFPAGPLLQQQVLDFDEDLISGPGI